MDGSQRKSWIKAHDQLRKQIYQIESFNTAGTHHWNLDRQNMSETPFFVEVEPRQHRIYNDVCIALLAHQIGATVVTRDITDFEQIRQVIDFSFRDVIESQKV